MTPLAAWDRVARRDAPSEREGLRLGYAGFGAAATRAALEVLPDVIRGAQARA